MKNSLIVMLLPLLFYCVGCNKQPAKNYFTLWNECDSLSTLKNYVSDVTNEKSPNFIPVEDRIATFDMDGTFIGELYKTYFEYNMLEYRGLDDPTYVNKDPYVVETAQNIRDFVRTDTPLPRYSEEYGFDIKHAVAAAKAYSGMSLDEFDKYVKDYAKKTPFGFKGMTYATSFYKPMLELVEYLQKYDFILKIITLLITSLVALID